MCFQVLQKMFGVNSWSTQIGSEFQTSCWSGGWKSTASKRAATNKWNSNVDDAWLIVDARDQFSLW